MGASSPKHAQTGPAAATTEGGFYLDVCNVSYSVTRQLPDTTAVQRLTCRARKETVPILNNINLSVRPGELIALMGPSGAGKSSLLNILSGRVVPTSGEVCVNGRAQDPATMRHILNYIPQDDTLYESLTPRALLSYQAELQLPHLRTAEERGRHVESVLRMLDISKCADTVIGEEGNRGISGGQRKRVSIAMGFLSDPRLLFLDEPTSGLDSNTAEEVVQILRSLVEQTNRTIVCTIHQPSWHIFSLFDRLILLDSGSLIYDGAISQTQEAFNQAGFPTPTNSNPADHFMSILIDQRRRGTPVVLASSDARPSADQFFGSKGRIQHAEDAQNELDAGYATSFFTQVWVLLRRSSWIFTKDPKQLRTRILLAVIVSTFLGICYLQLPLDQGSTTSRLSVLFTTVLFLGMNSLMVCFFFIFIHQKKKTSTFKEKYSFFFFLFSALQLTVVLFPQERAVVLREYADGIYSAPAFFLAKIITVIFFQIINGLVFGTIIYWMAGMVPTATSFFLYTAVGMVIGSISVVLGVGIGTLLPSVDLASSIVVYVKFESFFFHFLFLFLIIFV
ncbi:MAG: ATP-binding cassette domain-containing protein [archaeon]|nr:ATP-binding cassette domain-containing protein [archaeon]